MDLIGFGSNYPRNVLILGEIILKSFLRIKAGYLRKAIIQGTIVIRRNKVLTEPV